ncbi:MAG: OmpH family outer membrane protein [Bacteroidales bacterium]
MKRIILGLLVLSFNASIAQSLAYIETDKIVEKMPEYELATNEIDSLVNVWRTEVDKKFATVEDLYQEYVKAELLLTNEIKKEKQEEIIEAEKVAKEYREQKFGREGELSKIEESKLKPIREKILETAAKVGKDKNYDYVFEKTTESGWIYTNPDHDLTGAVLSELGL